MYVLPTKTLYDFETLFFYPYLRKYVHSYLNSIVRKNETLIIYIYAHKPSEYNVVCEIGVDLMIRNYAGKLLIYLF